MLPLLDQTATVDCNQLYGTAILTGIALAHNGLVLTVLTTGHTFGPSIYIYIYNFFNKSYGTIQSSASRSHAKLQNASTILRWVPFFILVVPRIQIGRVDVPSAFMSQRRRLRSRWERDVSFLGVAQKHDTSMIESSRLSRCGPRSDMVRGTFTEFQRMERTRTNKIFEGRVPHGQCDVFYQGPKAGVSLHINDDGTRTRNLLVEKLESYSSDWDRVKRFYLVPRNVHNCQLTEQIKLTHCF